jgi:glycine cleavage system pyridoxal-binding protein P
MATVGFSRVEELSNQTIPDNLLNYINSRLSHYSTFLKDREVETSIDKLILDSNSTKPSFFIEKNHANKVVSFVP